MCIRDRARGVVGAGAGHGPGGLWPVHLRLQQSDWRPATDGCLLYTSDAADERSSVDLGGRRIIKKKTREGRIRGQCYQQIRDIKEIRK
mgnify:CR=1 FL=1